ncbi:MAG: sugar transporter substrate-binding protein [Blastococcus sp.]|jgi:L-arabinose transport system substrate-binding protein|nr:sugar transporter substrate-binding protein [Blastococcus sp.]
MSAIRSGRVRSYAAVAVAAIALTACSSGKETADSGSGGSDDGTIRIAYLQKQGDQQYFIDQANGAKAMGKELGAEVTVVNLGEDANKAISEVETAIAQDYDGIIIVVPDQQVGPQVIQIAEQAKVPLLASDDIIESSDGKPTAFVGFNGEAMGEQVGTKAGELFKEAGWDPASTRILRVSKEDLSVCEARVDAATAAFQAAAGTKDVEVIPVGTDATVVDAQDKTAAVITGNPGVKNWVVYGCNDESETGAVTALQNAGVNPDNIIGVGLGAYLTCKDWSANLDSGNKAALFISGTEVGRAAVEAMVKSIKDGTDLPPETIAHTEMVDATNWEDAGVVCT